MRFAIAAVLLLCSCPLLAQNAIPAGTLIPVMLLTGLNARKLRPDRPISARVMQNIPGTRIRRGAKVLGHVVEVTPTRLELRFDTVLAHGHRIPVTASLRALASMMEVDEAQIPEGGADRALPPDLRNSTQIGGDQVYRGEGPVTHGMDIVGQPTPYGVVGQVAGNPPCRAAIDGNQRPQAFWLFSTDACGPYGFQNLSIVHAGRARPIGVIVIIAPPGKLNVRSGSGLLLRIQAS